MPGACEHEFGGGALDEGERVGASKEKPRDRVGRVMGHYADPTEHAVIREFLYNVRGTVL